MANRYLRDNFAPVHDELTATDLAVTGVLPPHLDGRYLRIGPNPAVDDGPKWFKVAIACSVILTLLSAASFTGGLINRFVDSSLTGLFGKRAVPRQGHVIVVGLGQVGLVGPAGRPVVAVLPEPARHLAQLAVQHHLGLRGRQRAVADAARRRFPQRVGHALLRLHA